jgi:hypothetical protein
MLSHAESIFFCLSSLIGRLYALVYNDTNILHTFNKAKDIRIFFYKT